MSDTSPRRRTQVSLLSLLLLMTTVAAVVGLYASWQKIEGLITKHAAREAELQAELSPILEENMKLRAERRAIAPHWAICDPLGKPSC